MSTPAEFIEDLASRGMPEGQIGRYTLKRELGRGGMGTVYLADHASDDFRKQVALKVIRRGVDTEDVLRRFDEAEVYFHEAIDLLSQTLGPEHGNTLSTRSNLASMLLNSGDPVGAAEQAGLAVQIGAGTLGPSHPAVGRYLQNHSKALELLGRTDEAQSYFERSTGPLMDTDSLPQYREECLAAADEFYRSTGKVNEAARLETALQGEG